MGVCEEYQKLRLKIEEYIRCDVAQGFSPDSKKLHMLKNILIVGGTSGVGLELAKMYHKLGHTVIIAGRKNPDVESITYVNFVISANTHQTIENLDIMLDTLPNIHTLIYAAGFYQEGHIDNLKDTDILQMINVGLLVPTLLVQRLKNNEGKPLAVMLITSSSQYTPREFEPVYTATKAGLGMLGDSVSLDPDIGKVLVAAPSGMKTPFWESHNKDTSEFLDPSWVAEQIIDVSNGPFKYRYAHILKNPSRVEIIQTRQ